MEINSSTNSLSYCQSVQWHTLRSPFSKETQTGHKATLRWILCGTLPVELVLLDFHFFSCLHPSFLSCSITFSPTVWLLDAVLDFSIFLWSAHSLRLPHWQVPQWTFNRKYKVKLGLYNICHRQFRGQMVICPR